MDTAVQELAALVAAEVTRSLLAQLVDRLPPAPGAAQPPPPPSAPPAVFRREGDVWTLSYDGEVTRLKDCRGFRHLARLLARPNEPVHVLELVQGGSPVPASSGLPVLDARAKAEYRRRLEQIELELHAADVRGDARRGELLVAEREVLVRELSRAVGIGRRERTTGGTSERARIAVTKAIRSGMRSVEEHHASLGDHLHRTVRTGVWCSYSSDPAPAWVC